MGEIEREGEGERQAATKTFPLLCHCHLLKGISILGSSLITTKRAEWGREETQGAWQANYAEFCILMHCKVIKKTRWQRSRIAGESVGKICAKIFAQRRRIVEKRGYYAIFSTYINMRHI